MAAIAKGVLAVWRRAAAVGASNTAAGTGTLYSSALSHHLDGRASSMSAPSSKSRRRMFSDSEPFYGAPLAPSSRYSSPRSEATDMNAEYLLPSLSPLQRLVTLVHSSLTAMNDPARADAVAAVGEVTGSYALSRIKAGMDADEHGRRVLKDRPLVDEIVAGRAARLLRRHEDGAADENVDRGGGMTFGAAYADFLRSHGFDPSERSPVRFLSDPDLSYVMTRYRQCHDYWHVLTGLPPTVLGELALKWLELLQTGLPLAALSATSGTLGALGLTSPEREALREVYLPWAVRVGGNMREYALMCVYYEEELETDLDTLRKRLRIEAAPTVEWQ